MTREAGFADVASADRLGGQRVREGPSGSAHWPRSAPLTRALENRVCVRLGPTRKTTPHGASWDQRPTVPRNDARHAGASLSLRRRPPRLRTMNMRIEGLRGSALHTS
jgi:hypothetical protein